MAIQMQLWRIQGDRPERLSSTKLDLEARLETWICDDLSLVGDDLLLLGRQVATASGHAVDVMALDREGNLVLLELKRGRTPRDVVAQLLDYAAWAHGLSPQEVEQLAERYRQRPLGELFAERFHSELPEALNQDQRLVIVATALDPQSERIVHFLSSRYGVNINVVFFDYYRSGDQELVGRSWLISPEEVQRSADALGTSKRRPILTLNELEGLADEHGVGDLYRALHEGLAGACDQMGTTQSNVTYRWRVPSEGRMAALVSVHPKVSGPEQGLIADVRVEDLARHLRLPEQSLRAALPAPVAAGQVKGLYLYDEGFAFKTLAEVERFLSELAKPAGELRPA